MTDNRDIGRALLNPHDDLAHCVELLRTIHDVPDAELPARLSAIACTMLGIATGGFHVASPRTSASLIEDVSCDGRRFGCFAFDGPPALRPRLVALARLTSLALSQRRKQADQQQIVDHIYDSIIAMDMAGFITSWNSGAERMFGYAADEAIGRNVLFLYAGESRDLPAVDEFAEQGGREMEVRRRRKSGEAFWARLSLSKVYGDDGTPIGIIAYLSDITESVEARQRLLLHAKIFEQSDQGIVITDEDRRVLSVNPAYTRITGFSAGEANGSVLGSLLSNNLASFLDDIRSALARDGKWHGELHATRKNGERFPTLVSVSTVPALEGGKAHLIWTFSDLTEQKLAAERIHLLAYHDAITDLPNRSLFLELTGQALAETRRDKRGGAVLLADLNRFKPINDNFGHEAGNALLREVAARFRCSMRDGDIIARIGDDEFAVALFEQGHNEKAGVVAQRLLASLDDPFHVLGHEVRISASIGISVYPEDGGSIEALLRNADVALYRAKQTGNSAYVFYSEEMNERSLERLTVEAGLRRALKQNELVLHYQPKVDIATGALIGAEALLRWQHPERGLVPPGEFIPIAEESGLIVSLGEWVLEEACRRARQWHDAGRRPIRIAVNLSARQFIPGLADNIRQLLKRHGLPAEWLELEITESMLMNSVDEVTQMMDELTGMGIALSLDDFGTGYSSLSYLKRFPIETIKIDRSFVRGTPEDSDDCAIAAAIVSMSKQLKLRVIAEGVETGAQAQFMRSLGCDEIQGFLISPPVAVDAFEAMLMGEADQQARENMAAMRRKASSSVLRGQPKLSRTKRA